MKNKLIKSAVENKIFLFLILLLFQVQLLFSQVSLVSSNLPIIIINTSGKTIIDDVKIDASMGIIYNQDNNRNTIYDKFNNYNGNIGIEIKRFQFSNVS